MPTDKILTRKSDLKKFLILLHVFDVFKPKCKFFLVPYICHCYYYMERTLHDIQKGSFPKIDPLTHDLGHYHFPLGTLLSCQ